jgi:hypothetical protein
MLFCLEILCGRLPRLLYCDGESLWGFDGEEAQAEAGAILNSNGRLYRLVKVGLGHPGRRDLMRQA